MPKKTEEKQAPKKVKEPKEKDKEVKKAAKTAKKETKTAAKKNEKETKAPKAKKAADKKVAEKKETEKAVKKEKKTAAKTKKNEKKAPETKKEKSIALPPADAQAPEELHTGQEKVEEVKEPEKAPVKVEEKYETFNELPGYESQLEKEAKKIKWIALAALGLSLLLLFTRGLQSKDTFRVSTKPKEVTLDKFRITNDENMSIEIPGNWYPTGDEVAVEISKDGDAKYIMSLYFENNIDEARKQEMAKGLKENYGAEDYAENMWKIVDVIDEEHTNLVYIRYLPESQQVIEMVFENVDDAVAEKVALSYKHK